MLLRQSFFSIVCLGQWCPSVPKRMLKNACHESLFDVLLPKSVIFIDVRMMCQYCRDERFCLAKLFFFLFIARYRHLANNRGGGHYSLFSSVQCAYLRLI